MSWEIFRCDIDCADDPNMCINEDLYKTMTDALVSGGFLAQGYECVVLRPHIVLLRFLSLFSPAPE
jgi:hypothetical protein